tara:strand:- start:30 stop:428 length:399 start_codon:yes stop_codon:yes gene_type:complete
MSEIKTDKLTGVGTAGVIVVTGEGNSTTTNLQQGLAKCWYSYNQDDDVVNDSLNASSVTDEATGHNFVNFSNNMANAGYSSPMKTTEYRERFEANTPVDKSTSRGITCEAFNSSGSVTDPQACDMIIMGDLA